MRGLADLAVDDVDVDREEAARLDGPTMASTSSSRVAPARASIASFTMLVRRL